MLIDIIVLVLCGIALFKGLRKGFVLAVFSLLSFVIGLAAALKLSALVAVYLGRNINVAEKWLPFLAFILVFIVVILLVRLGARVIEKFLQLAMLGWLNKLCGVALYVILYLIILSIVLFYAEQLNLIRKQTVTASISYPVLSPLGPKVINWLAAVVPVFENMFLQLQQFFGQLPAQSH